MTTEIIDAVITAPEESLQDENTVIAASETVTDEKPKKGVKRRLESDQTDILNEAFAKKQRLSKEDAAKLGAETGLRVEQVTSWFTNKRRSLRKGAAKNENISHPEDPEVDASPLADPAELEAQLAETEEQLKAINEVLEAHELWFEMLRRGMVVFEEESEEVPPPEGADQMQHVKMSKERKQILKEAFEENPRPDSMERRRLAAITGLSMQQIVKWFSNRRQKVKHANV